MNDSDGIARSLPRISPYQGGEPVLQGNTRFYFFSYDTVIL